MEAGMLPPNWKDMVNNSSEMATPKYLDLDDTWLNGQSNVGAPDQLLDTFAIVTDQHKSQKKNTPGSTPVSHNIPISASKGYNSPGDSSPPSQHNQMKQDASK